MNKKMLLIFAGGAIALGIIIFFVFFHRVPMSNFQTADGENGKRGELISSEGMNDINVADENDKNDENDVQIDESTYYGKQVAQLRKMKAGSDYIESQVISMTESQQEADVIAMAVNGEILEYTDGVAVFKIKGTVMDLMIRLAQENETVIEVTPNFLYSSQMTTKSILE